MSNMVKSIKRAANVSALVHSWGTGELNRRFEHRLNPATDKVEECMVIRRPIVGAGICIPISEMHLWYPIDDTEWGSNLRRYGMMAACLQLPPTDAKKEIDFKQNGTARRLVDYVQDGFDELKKMKPHDVVEKAVAEFEATIDGTKFSGDITG